jgi:hypothetical protein
VGDVAWWVQRTYDDARKLYYVATFIGSVRTQQMSSRGDAWMRLTCQPLSALLTVSCVDTLTVAWGCMCRPCHALLTCPQRHRFGMRPRPRDLYSW